jgi:Ca-activated chloride channel family protein
MTSRGFRSLVPVLGVLAALVLARGDPARSQGIIIDRRPHIALARSYEVREVSVDARVRDQVAEVQVSQTFHNPGSVQLEAEYDFPLPEEGTIQNFVLLVDGREWPGRLLPKDEARRIYEEIVRTKRDPALLEYMGRGLYRTSVFPIPPGADRKVTMRYTQVCKRDRDVVEFAFPFSTQKFTAKPIERLALHLDIRSREPIKSLYSPGEDLDIERRGEHEARISLVRHDVVPRADFRLVYTIAEGALGATVLSVRPTSAEDGYFLLLASPEVKSADSETRARPKTVVFVLDRSGSMAGKKLDQARRALRFVLDNLREDDTFNIVAYDDRVETFRPELQRYSSRAREEAVRFIDNIREGGSTNIDAALKSALGQVPDDSRPSYVLFLTDGLPTAGETNELTIADDCRKANGRRARVFAFGVGFDVNARLLDRISGGNSGTSTYVKPDEDIEAHVARFYSKMTSPVLADIRIELEHGDVNRVYPRDIPDLFEGGQLILAGRYRDSGRTTLRLTGRVGDERRRFEFPVDLASAGGSSTYDFVERLWAMRRVGFIIDQVDLHGRSKELIDELVALSTRYGILTPYTSFLADEGVRLHAQASNASRARNELGALESVTGQSGVGQRAAKGYYLESRQASEPFATTATSPASALADAPAAQEAKSAGLPQGQGQGQSARAPLFKKRKPSVMTGAGGGFGGAVGANAPGLAVNAKDAEGRDTVATTVRRVGAKTFYFKDKGWIDSTVGDEELGKAVILQQFSDAFFKLVRTQSAEQNQYFTFEEPVTVKLDGTVYRVDPGAP